MNSIIISGKISNVKVGESKNGTYANARLTSKRVIGEKEVKTFVNLRAYGDVVGLLHEGDDVLVKGSIKVDSYEKDGNRKTVVMVIPYRVEKTPEMSNDINEVTLMGWLANDPKGLGKVTKGSLAVHTTKEQTDFIGLSAFGKTGETIAAYAKKGTKLLIAGAINSSSYEKDGEKIYNTDVVVNQFEFAEKKADSSATPTPTEEPQVDDGWENIPDDIDEELPFN